MCTLTHTSPHMHMCNLIERLLGCQIPGIDVLAHVHTRAHVCSLPVRLLGSQKGGTARLLLAQFSHWRLGKREGVDSTCV